MFRVVELSSRYIWSFDYYMLLYGKDEIKFDDVSNALMNNEYCEKDK